MERHITVAPGARGAVRARPLQACGVIENRRKSLAEDKLYKAEYLGSGTFVISKPSRKKAKRRQSELKNPRRGSRK